MDKTVRLWHISRAENLCTFKHTDFVPSIQFHPRDDRFFLAGSLDCKLRLWSIPDKSVAFWSQLPDMITAVSFTPDGKTCIAGTLGGLCMLYETEGLKYQTQIHAKSTRGQNAKGSKITGIQTAYWPPGNERGEVKLLISSNDSRVRLYNLRDKSLEIKFRGHENNCSQIRASFADDTGNVICGSEDRKTYIWSTAPSEGDQRRNQRPVEMFEAHNSITTCAVMAPLKTRLLLAASEDPIFDLCNPPPVTLVARADRESPNSSRPPTDAGSSTPLPTPTTTDAGFKRVAETPAYLARSAHKDGNIIVTADYTGSIKVFRQDCAYTKRLRAADNWDTASVFSKRTGGSRIGRPSSLFSSRRPTPSIRSKRRDSTSTQPADDRIMSWRQDISHGSFDSVNARDSVGGSSIGGLSTGGIPTPRRSQARSASPRKNRMSVSSANLRPTSMASGSPTRNPLVPTPTSASVPAGIAAGADDPPKPSTSSDQESASESSSVEEEEKQNETSQPSKSRSPSPKKRAPLSIQTNSKAAPPSSSTPAFKTPLTSTSTAAPAPTPRSWAFWSRTPTLGTFPTLTLTATSSTRTSDRRTSTSRLTDEEEFDDAAEKQDVDEDSDEEDEDDVRCKACGADEFRVRVVKGASAGMRDERKLVCGRCGALAG